MSSMDTTKAAAFEPAARGCFLKRARPIIVAVDGPAGSGKSSICFHVCAKVGWTYVNTGAIYRAVGLIAAREGVAIDDECAVADLVDRMAPDLRWDSPTRTLWYRGRDITPELASEEAGLAASKVAKQALVRERLLPVQKQLTLAAPEGALVDGRDIGTVVFPDADLKIFLTASLEERSRRRLNQLGMKQDDADSGVFDDIMRGIASRDERDEHRGVSPLKQAADAVVVDTSTLSLEQTVDAIIELLTARGLVSRRPY